MDSPVFLDANAIVYVLDETSSYYSCAVQLVQRILAGGAELCTSHHVIEEVIYVIGKATGGNITALQVVDEIEKIPNLVLVEPAAKLSFAKSYSGLIDDYNLGVNDALLLQLMIDSGITKLLSYDKKFVNKAKLFGISCVVEGWSFYL